VPKVNSSIPSQINVNKIVREMLTNKSNVSSAKGIKNVQNWLRAKFIHNHSEFTHPFKL
jgi:HD superfamily phosphohydrolase